MSLSLNDLKFHEREKQDMIILFNKSVSLHKKLSKVSEQIRKVMVFFLDGSLVSLGRLEILDDFILHN